MKHTSAQSMPFKPLADETNVILGVTRAFSHLTYLRHRFMENKSNVWLQDSLYKPTSTRDKSEQ